RAVSVIAAADRLIIGGSSLSFYPAGGLGLYFRVKHVVVINKTPISADSAELVINDSIGAVLGKIKAIPHN
ncbi:MAG: NAD-dependent protein deacylase, partial [Oscillospiraceae bacterium]|nr:NAD-dependent protein deacylase [Oscillospiraceae bacterium]